MFLYIREVYSPDMEYEATEAVPEIHSIKHTSLKLPSEIIETFGWSLMSRHCNFIVFTRVTPKLYWCGLYNGVMECEEIIIRTSFFVMQVRYLL